jgi:hypothetical protein
MHVQFPCNLDKKLVDEEQSYLWQKFGDIKGETESTIVTATSVCPILAKNEFITHDKSKAVPLHAMEAHGGRGGITPTHT